MILNLGGGYERFPNAINVDKDKNRVNVDRDNGRARFKGDILHDLEEPLRMKRKASLIIAKEIIEHLPRPMGFLYNCHELLQNDGVLYLTTNNRFSLINRIFHSYEHSKRGPQFSVHKSLMGISELTGMVGIYFNILSVHMRPYQGRNNFLNVFRRMLDRFLPDSLRENIVIVAVRK